MSGGGDRGMTLFELVVAMAIFALVATMGTQALTGAVRGRDRLDDASGKTRALGATLALMRRDLGDAVPVTFAPPGGGLRSAMDVQTDRLALSVSGQPSLGDPGAADLRRVIWRRDAATGTLTRGDWPTLDPVSADQRGPDVPFLTGVTDMSVEVFLPQAGWVPASQLQPQGGVGTTLPRAARVVLDLAGLGPVTLIQGME